MPGPWLTLALPGGLLFALFDRRPGARAAGVVVVALVAGAMAGTGIGLALAAVGAAVTVACAITVSRGDRQLGLDGLVAPALATAGFGLAATLALSGGSVARWEATLGAAVAEVGRRAVEQYRGFGMRAESLELLEDLSADFTAGVVAIWPALAALGLWLGVWIAHRLLGRWGRVGSGLGRRLTPLPFERFRPPEALVWPLIAGLAGLWTETTWVQRAALNAALALGLVYAITGLAVLWWWLGRRGMGTPGRLGLVALMLLMPFAVAAWVAIGLADVWIGFREHERTL